MDYLTGPNIKDLCHGPDISMDILDRTKCPLISFPVSVNINMPRLHFCFPGVLILRVIKKRYVLPKIITWCLQISDHISISNSGSKHECVQ